MTPLIAGTALKILFSDNPEEFLGRIKRNELIAFVNTFAKVSSSVHSVALMFDRRYKYLVNLGYTIVIVMGSFLLFLLCAYKIYAEMGNKVERMFKNLPKDGSGSQKKVKKD
jgi:ERO1-like protein alpha